MREEGVYATSVYICTDSLVHICHHCLPTPYPCTFSFFSSPPLLPSSFRQDVDGKHRVEIVRKLEVEKPQSPSDSGNEDDPLIPVINDEKVVLLPSKQTVQYFEHRHLRYFYSEEAGKYLLLR